MLLENDFHKTDYLDRQNNNLYLHIYKTQSLKDNCANDGIQIYEHLHIMVKYIKIFKY